MKLLVFSDIHSDKRALERLLDIDADRYICAGDLVSWARGLDAMGEVLKRRADKMWIMPGNHESESDIAGLASKFGFHTFHGESFDAGGVHVGGLGYSNPTPFNTPGEYSEAEIARRLQSFAGLKPLVLVCHCPPKNTKLDRVREGVHAGSSSVGAFIEQHQPAFFFCGHIHEGEGVTEQIGATQAVNVGKKGFLLDSDKIK